MGRFQTRLEHHKKKRLSRAARAARAVKMPKSPLPVTLLSGFLGSGKTTLLQHILRSEHGLRIAVVVNDVGAINVDASLIKQTHRLTKTSEKVISLQNGCICCTLRGDLLEELVKLAQLQEFDYIIIESSGISEPEQVAETFDARLAEQMGQIANSDGTAGLDKAMMRVLKQLKAAGGLQKFARLDTTVTVIDSFTMMNDFDTADLLSSRRDDVTPEDERTVSDLMVDQIEFADVIVLNKMDMITPETKLQVIDLVRKLNRRAKILDSSYAKVDVQEIVNTGLFKLDLAQTGYGWLQDLHAMTVREVNGRNVVTPKPETEEYNVQSFIYTRQRPFHPRRLFALLYDKFILQMEQPEDDDDEDDDEDMRQEEDFEMVDDDGTSVASSSQSSHSTTPTVHSPETAALLKGSEDKVTKMNTDPLDIPSNETILANKRAHATLARLFRSKGEYFLASRPHRAGEWSQAGAILTLTGGRPWFCTISREEYITGDKEVDGLVEHDIAKGGEWGDRRQEIVFIGEKLDHAGIEAMLDECLLTDSEFSEWQRVMRDEKLRGLEQRDALEDMFEDGFPDWAGDGGGGGGGEDAEGHEHRH